ncbi:MAG: NAD(P)H-dependent oxidoreductase [Bacteriovorax sp.]|jgi:nitroreductase|nr:NAD(P)H-dependent oxidoreductase [Bacteriovorax sp.]
MQNLTPEKLIESMEWRYATKKFDPTKKINEKTWELLERALILTPSSYGLQPWKFIIVQDPQLKEKLKASSWNQSQVTDCSHHVVFAIKEKLDEAHIDHYIHQIAKVRGQEAASMEGFKKMMMGDLVSGSRSKVISEWAARQTYIALGNFMTAAAVIGVDTCPLEGIDPVKYDEILGLTDSGWKVVVACPAGYRAIDDKYSSTKKVRFDAKDLIVHK